MGTQASRRSTHERQISCFHRAGSDSINGRFCKSVKRQPLQAFLREWLGTGSGTTQQPLGTNYNPYVFNNPYNFNSSLAAGNYNYYPSNDALADLARRQSRLAADSQRIQQQLISGNLNPDRIARLQNKLARIQAEQASLNNTLGYRLPGQQQRLRQLLASGTLSPEQTVQVQNLLAQLQWGQGGLLPASNLLGGSGFLTGLRTVLGF